MGWLAWRKLNGDIEHGGRLITPARREPGRGDADPLWQLLITRLDSERTRLFLVANSFLLTAFALPRHGIQFVPPAVGIASALLRLISINYREKTKLL